MTTDGVKITFFGKVNESLDITLKFIMAFGLCFQLPVLLTLMGKAGLVSSDGLGAMRKYAVVAILVLAALVMAALVLLLPEVNERTVGPNSWPSSTTRQRPCRMVWTDPDCWADLAPYRQP